MRRLPELEYPKKGAMNVMKNAFRYIFILALCAAALFLCAGNIFAANEEKILSFSHSGYSGSENEFAPDGGLRLSDDNRQWTAHGCAVKKKNIEKNGYSVMNFDIVKLESSSYVSLTLPVGADITDTDTVTFGIKIDSDKELRYGVTAVLLTDGTCASSTCGVISDEINDSADWNMIYIDTSSLDGELRFLSIVISSEDVPLPYSVSVSTPMGLAERAAGFRRADAYMTDGFFASAGEVDRDNGTVLPDENGKAYISGSFVSAGTVCGDTYFEVSALGISSGNMTLGVICGEGDSVSEIYTKKVSVTDSDDGVFVFPTEINSRIVSYSLSFDNIECDGSFKISKVRVFSDGEKNITRSPLGSVTSVIRENDSVFFSGVMERESVNKYAGGKLGFFTVFGNDRGDITKAVKLAEINLTTKFEFTLDLSAYKDLADTYMFFAAVVEKNGDIIPFSLPRYADRDVKAPAEEKSASCLGFCNAASAGAFESNASYVIVDVSLDKFFTQGSASAGGTAPYASYVKKSSGTLTAESRGNLYCDYSHLKDLDREIGFYTSAGMNVYLCLKTERKIQGFTFDEKQASNYTPKPDDPDSAAKYAAIVGFLAERYPDIDGFVMGTGVNRATKTGCSISLSEARFAELFAELCRITYNAASESIPGVSVIIPFDRSATDVNYKTLAIMLSDKLSDMGGIPISFMYSSSSADVDFTSQNSITKTLSELGIDVVRDYMYLYEPKYSYIYGEYLTYAKTEPEPLDFQRYFADICEVYVTLCEQNKVRAAFISLRSIGGGVGQDFYLAVKNIDPAGTNETTFDFYAESGGDGSQTGEYTLWDFSDKYYPLGFIAGDGISSSSTEYSELFSAESGKYTRVLRSVFTLLNKNTSTAGIILKNLPQTSDISNIDGISLRCSLSEAANISKNADDSGNTESGEESLRANVVVVLGNNDFRAEYVLENVPHDEIFDIRCDLREYEHSDKIDYIGIMVYANREVVFDLSRVVMTSETLDSNELKELVLEKAGVQNVRDIRNEIIIFAVIVSVSASVILVLVRRDREEAAAKRAEEKNGQKTMRMKR